MSTEYTRYFSALAKYTAGDPIDDRDLDGEFDAMVTALNRKVMIKATAPGSPINGQTWIDTTTKLLKWYRGTEWISIASVHVAAAAMAAPQAGDLWYDTGTGTLSYYTGAGWSALEPSADNQRDGLICSRHDKDTLVVAAGLVYVGASRVSTTAVTSLALGTAANWIGGISLRATSTWAYIYVNAAGDIKLHTSAPDATDVAGNTAGILRYKDFTGTYYRSIGSFYMSATGSGELDADTWNDGVSNFPQDLNRVLQVVNYKTGAYASGATVMPADDTIPQITEGDEYLSVDITPSSAKNKLKIEVLLNVEASANVAHTCAVFIDGTAGALSAVSIQGGLGNTINRQLTLKHYMTAGSASKLTFKVRAGCGSAGTLRVNGFSGSRQLGGVNFSSITITEIQP